MTVQDILVNVDDSEYCKARLDVAAALAKRFDAHLAGVYVRRLPQVPDFVRAQYGGMLDSLQQEYLGKAQETAAALFERSVAAHGVGSHAWRAVDGDVVDVMVTHARYVDLTVIGQNEGEEQASLVDYLALDAGRPVLVVPDAGAYPTVGERVVVAWNAGREATRAVNDALPLLRRAKKVMVLTINANPSARGHGEEPGADIALHLARHGVDVEVRQEVSRDLDVGETLLARLADEDADLLVMGAYGRSRVREIILGGATRHVLQHMTVPVLMSH